MGAKPRRKLCVALTAPTHWSYSSWATFNRCPFAYQQSYLLGNRSPQGPSAARGERIHKLAEYFLRGKITGGVPGALDKFSAEFQNLKAAKPVVEKFWAVTEDWKFINGRGWCVMKMDAAVLPTNRDPTLIMVDFKTGREYPDHDKQGELYLAIGFAKHPEIESASTEFWYTDLGYSIRREYTREQVKEQVVIWQDRGTRLLTGKKFKPTPSEDGCKWCHLRTDRGGVCNEWTKLD